jgi:hypothetical protein
VIELGRFIVVNTDNAVTEAPVLTGEDCETDLKTAWRHE